MNSPIQSPSVPARDELIAALAERDRELAQALERQTATAEILKVIASSPTDVQPVFQAIANSAKRLLHGRSAFVARYIADMAHLAAFTSIDPDTDALARASWPRPMAGNPIVEAVQNGRTIQAADIETVADDGLRRTAARQGWRSALTVPLASKGVTIGSLTVTRVEPGAFAEDDVQLMRTFADQAVIAIENARLFNETKEALERQTATAEVLGAIGRSVSDAAPVFEEILNACQRLFGSEEMGIYTVGADEMVRVAAWRGPRALEASKDVSPLADSITGKMIRERRTHHIPDLKAEPNLSPRVRERAERLGSASLLYAPMLWEDRGLGSILVVRSPPRPFTERETELLRTFADQAAIAIENARLFNETKEALERQTATADILKVIANSPSDVQPVFQAIADSAKRLLGGHSALVTRYMDGLSHIAAFTPISPEADAALAASYPRPLKGNPTYEAVRDGIAFRLPDVEEADPEGMRKQARGRGWRSLTALPLSNRGAVIGAIAVTRATPGALADDDIQLLRTFADQAEIAIENARLLNDIREALQQQTATADVLKVISRSAFDPQAVLETLINSAVSLSGSQNGMIWQFENGAMHSRAFAKGEGRADFVAFMRAHPQSPGRGSATARVALTGEVQNIADVREDPDYADDLRRIVQTRATLGVPMKRGDELLGAIVMSKPETGLYPPRIVDLVKTFADQAVIAIENARLFGEVQAKTRDLEESLAQQTATADVLKTISRSAFDLQAVFDTLISSGVRLIGGHSGTICLRDADVYRYLAHSGLPPVLTEWLAEHPATPGRATAAGRVLLSGKFECIVDVLVDKDYIVPVHEHNRTRSMLAAPLLRDDRVEGVLVINRADPGTFTERQIELVQSFADQAVIALENVRLFEQVQAKTRDLEESLSQQTATADVLKVISRSAFDLQAVLDTLIGSAVKLCGADNGVIYLLRDEAFYVRAHHNPDAQPAFLETLRRRPQRAGRGSVGARVLLTGEMQQIPDVDYDPEYDATLRSASVNKAVLGLPLKRDGAVVGAITLARRKPGAYNPRQIEVAQTFADQAVIAIENVRLFDEVQARTRDLSEALQQQTATSDVLKVISRSAFDLQAVFNTLVTSAVELGGAMTGTICVRDGDVYRYRDTVGAEHTSKLALYLREHPAVPGRSTIAGRVLLSGKVERIPDCLADPEYVVPMGALASNVRSLLGVPLLRKDGIEGAIILTRSEPGEFTERQVEIVQTFADQAVIALENVRLFDEVQARTRDLIESLQQQTATSDVLKVISRSAFDLQSVLDTLVSSAADLIGAHSGNICVRDGDGFRYKAFRFIESERSLAEYLRTHPVVLGRGSIAGRTILSGKVEQIPDIREDQDYRVPVIEHGFPPRALVGVPLHGKDGLEGVFILSRLEPGPFAPRQIDILQTFADQAVIAIENTRLFDEVQARTRDLAASLDDLRKAQDRLVASEKLASLGQLTAGIAHEIKNPLNFVNNFSGLSRELLDELRELLTKAKLAEPEREEADELIGLVASNLDKVVTHGKRADSIVKNMLLHSREGSGERTSVNVNAMVEEALNLAYHGARAEKPGFNVTIAKSLDPAAGAADLYPQEITRVLLNLISNGFYATTKRKQSDANGGYEPTVSASTRSLGDRVAIVITDNGTGIPEEVKAKMFNPFFTTKPAGEGTGLGLSLSHDIVVKQHGGTLEVATEPGSVTEFTIVLPRGQAAS